MYTLSLEIINKCNLNCTYCYLGEKKNTYMSLETAQKIIDIAVHEANKQHDRTLLVYFIVREPLMAFNLMKDVVDYAKEKGVRDQVTIMIGGAPITQKYCDDIGSDIYTCDAASAADAAVKAIS